MHYKTTCHMQQKILHRSLLAAYFSTDFDCHISAENDNPSCSAKAIHPHECPAISQVFFLRKYCPILLCCHHALANIKIQVQ